jgi:hypothetical protein
VIIEIWPADWWNSLSRENRPAKGLAGELCAAMKRP